MNLRLVSSVFVATALLVHAEDVFLQPRWLPLTGHEQHDSAKGRREITAEAWADRAVYWNDDRQGQFLVSFIGPDTDAIGAKVAFLEVVHHLSNGVDVEELDIGAGHVDCIEESVVELPREAVKPLAFKTASNFECFLRPDRPRAVVVLEPDQGLLADGAAPDPGLGQKV